ncbi:putative glucose-6-phosphate 1-epimerase isoform X2 [Tripterygium wilfordii]|uniref:glucose-6-phosphate 1-epimerase n=1 Tax=Tripterygium wilfordii TaxID=458696 RepID=A0A7J7DKP7_TRIWF|nr:putative glucose-6-phosphate 1-epimerase isoform X2 [Tripterygium wilfordii]
MPFNIVNDGDGLPRILLTEPSGSSAEVLLYGGQVVSWKNEKREELLFISSKAIWKPPKAIMGGIPVCFPQFGTLGSLEQHGFARNRMWSLDSDPSPLSPVNNQSSVDLILKSTEEDLKTWPRSFELRLRVSLSSSKLKIITRVRNTDNKAFSFTLALRNYLSVSDISEVRVEGLETLDYFDNLIQGKRFTEQADAITFDDEIDRVYLRTSTKIAIIDHEKKRTLVLQKDGMPDSGIKLFLFSLFCLLLLCQLSIIFCDLNVTTYREQLYGTHGPKNPRLSKTSETRITKPCCVWILLLLNTQLS